MRIAIFIRGGEFKFYELGEATLEAFKSKYAAKRWRIVDITNCTTRGGAIKQCKKEIKQRIRKLKYESGKRKIKTTGDNEGVDKRAYRLVGSLKQYTNECRKFDATKLVGTRVF